MTQLNTKNPDALKFARRHGDFVELKDGWLLFEDGAKLLVEGHGVVKNLAPTDKWERAQLVEQFHSINLDHAVDEFDEFQSYLYDEEGQCPEGVDPDDDEEQLAHLKKLKRKVRRMESKFREARKARKEATPAWITAKKREEAEAEAEREAFRDKVKSIQL